MRTEPENVVRGRTRANGSAGPEEPGEGGEPFPLQRVLDDEGRADPRAVTLADEQLVALYRWMVLNRQLDERMIAMQRQGRIGFYIGSIGEEAAVFGTASAMEEGDWIFPCYREHGAALLRGMPLAAYVCDLLGNAGDLMLGHQMPCHEAWRPGRFTSISSPIGTQIPQAVGAAWAARIKGDDMVSLVYFGEGATSSNDFHTGLNFAAAHKVPVVFACRNNGWAISMPRERQTAAETIAQKALAYGMRGERVDGNDLLAVHAAARRARERAAAGGGPTLLECVTYRVEGHSTSDDPRAYRPAELVEPWRKKDPILRLRAHLAGRGLLGDEDEARAVSEAKERIHAAIVEAEAHPAKPPLATLFQDVYAEPLWQQREQLQELERALADDPRIGDPRAPRRSPP
ncbi:MAG TPA: thiamine pyrophosphate-dependent enzyme [Anaeromyxobacteraceae bacterium]|nr:thiamine pyrophosphate-dependent enzyme [Anaeromyxobacteraceae bacterium]